MPKIIFKAKIMSSKYAQAFLVLIAFLLMVLSTYYFVRNTELRHLRRNAMDAIRFTEINIKNDMQEPITVLGAVAEFIREMILNGADKNAVNNFFIFSNKFVDNTEEDKLLGVTGFYGVFDVFNDEMLIGIDTWDPPDYYDMKTRPWYIGALQLNGGTFTTEPYLNEYSGEITITLSRQIFGHNNKPLGIICVNIELNRVSQHAVDARFAENGYGLLLSKDMLVIAHPNQEMVGKPYRELRSDLVDVLDRIIEEGGISELVTVDYSGVESIIFVQRLNNGWYMGVVTPRNNYFRSARDLLIMLIVFGLFFAGLLIWLLMRINEEKAKADERTQLMFNATPLCVTYWDKNFNVVDCNQYAYEVYGLSNKQEYNEKFFDLMPEYQPDGSKSKEKARELMQNAFEKGYMRFEWLHRKVDGEHMPSEITLIPFNINDEPIVVGYLRDLREEKKIQMISARQRRLLDAVNTSAVILLANNDMDNFETSLLKCFDLLGHCLDVDRVQIWRNEMLEKDPHFILRYEWLSDYGKKCKTIPMGLHFPYTMKKEWAKKFIKGEYINAPVCELSEEDQAFLGYYDIKSIVIIPMFLEGDFWGFFSIDDCRTERVFSEEEISILTSAGIMMSSAVNRNIQNKKMREAEERTQIMLDAAPLSTIFWNKDLTLIDCNKEALNMFKVSTKEEFIENFRLLSPEYQEDGCSSVEKGGRLVRKALEEGYSRFEWIHQTMEGESIPADIICIRVKHKDEFTVTEYIRDLREQKAMIAEMRKAEIAEESSKAKSDFLARMSHEIRTPMNAILGITEIQLQDESHPQVTREAFERIYNSGDLLLGIINDILDLSKIEVGKLVLIPSQYDIASLIHDSVQLNIMRYESKPIEFILDIKEDLPLMLIGDELRIKQILNNLLSNAFKYTQEGNINLTIYSEPADMNDSSKVTLVFIVSDTGQGMTSEQVARLGTEYSRFNTEANRKTEGTGLGMNITRNLINLMNGKISIESTPGSGSTFTVRLPQGCIGSSTLGKELADNLMQLNLDNSYKIRPMQMKRDFMPYGRVLVVDDVETNLYVAKGLMAPYGLSIDTAMSGFEAVDKIRDGYDYDVIFMDHMMPRMDGIEATKIIRSLGYSKPVVALTANALAGQAEMFLESGFDDFISKPIDIRQLNMTLNKHIRDKQLPEIVEAARKQRETLYFGNGKKKTVDPQLAEFFVRDAKKTIRVMELIYKHKCRREDDISVFIINVHAMKSALANVGEKDLSAEAARLEKAGRERNIKLIMSDLPLFIELLVSVVEKLELKEGTQDVAGADDIPDLKEKLIAIKDACMSFDKKIAKNMLAELKQKTWPNAIMEQLSIISEKLLHSEFEETAAIINEYLSL